MTFFPTAPGRTYVNRARDAVLERGMAEDGSKTFHLTDRVTGATVSLSEDHLAFLVREAKVPMSVSTADLETAAKAAMTASDQVTGGTMTDRDFKIQQTEWLAIAKAVIESALPVTSSPLPQDERLLNRLDALLGIGRGSDGPTRYNAVQDATINAMLMAKTLREIARSGEGGTTGEGHADSIQRAKRVLDMFDGTPLGLDSRQSQGKPAPVDPFLAMLSKPTFPSERTAFEVIGGPNTPELRREMLRDIAEFIASAKGGMIEIENAAGKRSFDVSLIIHSQEKDDLSTWIDYESQYLTGEDATDVDSMPDGVFAKSNPIVFERQDGQEVEGSIRIDDIQSVGWGEDGIAIRMCDGSITTMRIA